MVLNLMVVGANSPAFAQQGQARQGPEMGLRGGFLRPDAGQVTIKGLQGAAFRQAAQLGGMDELKAVELPNAKVVDVGAPETAAAEQTADPTLVLNFDDVNKSAEADLPADNYLKEHGITLSAVSDNGTKVVIFKEGASVVPSEGRQNVMAQRVYSGPQRPVYYVLTFDKPIKSFTFSRPKLIAGKPDGITHPKWFATAYDEKGRMIIQDTYIGERMIGSHEDVPARSFTIVDEGRGIKSVRIDSDNKQHAAFSALLIDGIKIEK